MLENNASGDDVLIFVARFDQIFEGNTHYDTPELRHFDEVVAQYVRLYPERWSPAGIGMRVDILGCDLPGRTVCCFLDFIPRQGINFCMAICLINNN